MRRSMPVLALAAATALAAGTLGALARPASAADFDTTPHIVRDATAGGLGTSFVNDVAKLGGRLVYAYDGALGAELWISDGSSAGTKIVRDIVPGANASDPQDLTAFNGKVYFSAFSGGDTDRELWVTDGTRAGTKRVKDIQPGANGSYPAEFVAAGGWLYFSANDGTTGQELWRTKGTAATTQRVADINPGATGSGAGDLAAWGNDVVFRAGTATTGNEPWVSDGTGAGTHPVGNIASGSASSNPFDFTSFDVGGVHRFVFTATDVTHGYEMWISDGTSSTMVADINPAAGDSASPQAYTRLGNRLVFVARTVALGKELWATDGTAAGTVLVKDVNPVPGASGVDVETLATYAGKLYFPASDVAGNTELWVSGGTLATTHLVKDISPGFATGGYPGTILVAGGRLFFDAQTPATGDELWQSDGTATGTRMVKDIQPGPGHSYPTPLATIDNTLFFEAQEATHGEELWVDTLVRSTTRGHSRKATSGADRRRRIVVTVTVRASGTTPVGRVTLKSGSHVLGAGKLSGGRARIRITRKLGVGRHVVRASYYGSVRANRSRSAPFTVTIR